MDGWMIVLLSPSIDEELCITITHAHFALVDVSGHRISCSIAPNLWATNECVSVRRGLILIKEQLKFCRKVESPDLRETGLIFFQMWSEGKEKEKVTVCWLRQGLIVYSSPQSHNVLLIKYNVLITDKCISVTQIINRSYWLLTLIYLDLTEICFLKWWFYCVSGSTYYVPKHWFWNVPFSGDSESG